MGTVPKISENSSKDRPGPGWNDERLGILRKFAPEVENEFSCSDDSKEVVVSSDLSVSCGGSPNSSPRASPAPLPHATSLTFLNLPYPHSRAFGL
jgi:hypothetical protein